MVMQIDPTMASPAVSLGPDSRRHPSEIKKASQQAGSAQIEQAISEANHALEPFQMSLKFSKDADTGMIVVQVVDKSGEPVRQTPTEASLVIAASLAKLQGKLFSRQA
jgi:uncharacterized FlaG/YvyC family protein